jgi:hypothetical protein
VIGGKLLPLYHVGHTSISNWKKDLTTMKSAPWVELISDRARITIPYSEYIRSPIADIEKTFEKLHQVITWEDELAGFDGSTRENTKTKLRLHYIVDIYATAKEQESYYMYAMSHLIGMKRENFTDLTNPENLATSWSIWHETGHTQQQDIWTWESIGEVSVNIFSLYVGEQS